MQWRISKYKNSWFTHHRMSSCAHTYIHQHYSNLKTLNIFIFSWWIVITVQYSLNVLIFQCHRNKVAQSFISHIVFRWKVTLFNFWKNYFLSILQHKLSHNSMRRYMVCYLDVTISQSLESEEAIIENFVETLLKPRNFLRILVHFLVVVPHSFITQSENFWVILWNLGSFTKVWWLSRNCEIRKTT